MFIKQSNPFSSIESNREKGFFCDEKEKDHLFNWKILLL